MMNPRPFRISAAIVFGTSLLAASALAQTHPAAPESPYGGVTVEDVVARVNDQIITHSDYDRAMKEMDGEAKQRGATMQQMSEAHRDLLRNLIDQQLWLSKGKELGVNGETELVKRLDELRKQNSLDTMEDLEKAAKEQGISFEDFKANIRNQIITQQVMRDEVGRRVQFTQGEVERFYEAHKQDYVRPESVKLSEILISTGDAAGGQDDQAKLDAAKAKADDIEAKLHAGGDFTQLAKTFSDGTTASEGGDLGEYKRGALAKVLEDKTFALQSGQYTEPIRTRQGFVILKVVDHVPAGAPPLKDVREQVEENFYMSRMEPAMRLYLTEMREQAYIDIKPGYSDSGASPKEIKPVYSAYTPPVAKKKKKVERTRFRETASTNRGKSATKATDSAQASSTPAATPAATSNKKNKNGKVDTASMKPGKKEKIRFGQAPTTTLPSAGTTQTEDAGAVQTASATPEPVNPLEADTRPTVKTRFSSHATEPKKPRAQGPQLDPLAPASADAAEVADRQTQSAPLGLSGDTATKKKPSKTTTSEKKRMTKKPDSEKKDQPEMTPVPTVPGAPAPATAPQSTPAPAPAPQS
jgi:peptidyl-prolyl cis-trans isomerase SurA